MEEKLKEIDRLLASISVSGDNVIVLANARIKLKELFDALYNDQLIAK